MKAASGKELAHALQKNGWTLKRVQGSHHIFCKPGHTARISVPIHANRPLKIGLQKHLMDLAGLSERDL
ncbi:MAG: type II toxin-antitoxin system HicA family toxin [Gammaproteobacteria bacterium]